MRGSLRPLLSCCKGGVECSPIAGVGTDHPRFQLLRTIAFKLIMNFNQNFHLMSKGRVLNFTCCGVIHGGHDDKNAIGTEDTRFDDLVGFVNEVLAQDRQGSSATCRREKLWLALKRRRIS